MKTFLRYFNLLGVAALAVLCVFQWKTNRQLSLKAIGLEQTRVAQVEKIAEQEMTIRGDAADLDAFRHRLEDAQTELKEATAKLADAISAEKQVAAERDKLLVSLKQWMAAVAERDAAYKQAGEQIKALSGERNAAVLKYNELANKYNALVKDLDDARAKLAAGR